MLGLEAIASFAVLVTHNSSEAGVSVTLLDVLGSALHTFDTVTKANAFLLQSFQVSTSYYRVFQTVMLVLYSQLPSNTTNLTVEATGEGVALVQLIVSYNVVTKDESKYLSLELSTKKEREVLILNVLTRLLKVKLKTSII